MIALPWGPSSDGDFLMVVPPAPAPNRPPGIPTLTNSEFESTRNQIRFEVEEAYFTLLANQENIDTASLAVEQAEEALELANLRFNAGVGTQLDVLSATSELTEAQGNLVTAVLDYNRALAPIGTRSQQPGRRG